jgi:hypothetical protein
MVRCKSGEKAYIMLEANSPAIEACSEGSVRS